MNYTLISYTEASYYTDHGGYRQGDQSQFVLQTFTDDQRSEFVQAWAKERLKGGQDELNILIDGLQQYDLAGSDIYWEFNKLKVEMEARLGILRIEEKAKVAAALKVSEDAKKKAEEDLKIKQRLADLAQLEALKKKLGV